MMKRAIPPTSTTLDARAHRLIEQIDDAARPAGSARQMKNRGHASPSSSRASRRLSRTTRSLPGSTIRRSHRSDPCANVSPRLLSLSSTASSDSSSARGIYPRASPDQEKAQVSEGCYELLLVLADSLDQTRREPASPRPGRLCCGKLRTRPITSGARLTIRRRATRSRPNKNNEQATPPRPPLRSTTSSPVGTSSSDGTLLRPTVISILTLQRQSDHF